ncbi:MAG: hypothetical protein FWC27_04545 [Firmicutes bacterium]|nr:hypothetical protein [Bacillota bacterium]
MDTENTEQAVQVAVQENVSSGTNARALMKLPIPLIVVAAYLAMGFLQGWWHPGWLVFLAIPVYYELAAMAAVTETRKRLNLFPIAPLCVAAYLLLGFFLNLWHPGWLIFLCVPFYYILVNAVFRQHP